MTEVLSRSGVVRGKPDGNGRRVAIAVARFNELITERLLSGAMGTLERHGVQPEDIRVVEVPGAFELPLTCRWLAQGGWDAVIALGAVIRGATTHYDYVCGQSAAGILRASMDADLPVIFGVLTCDTLEQAMERAGSKAGNKGADAAVAALEMASLRSELASPE